MGSNGRAEERRRDRRAWKAQRKILSKKRSRRAVRRIIGTGYALKAERHHAARGLEGAFGDRMLPDAVLVSGAELPGIPNVPTVTIADQQHIHAEHHYGEMAACSNPSCQWAVVMEVDAEIVDDERGAP